jgi:hypothetical protein
LNLKAAMTDEFIGAKLSTLNPKHSLQAAMTDELEGLEESLGLKEQLLKSIVEGQVNPKPSNCHEP